jgi:DNA ligase-1
MIARLAHRHRLFYRHAFPQTDLRTLQVGGSVIYRALAGATKMSDAEFRRIASSHGDAGKTAFEVLDGRTTLEPFGLIDSYEFFEQLPKLRGPVAKKDALQNRFGASYCPRSQYVGQDSERRFAHRIAFEGLVEEAYRQSIRGTAR